MSELLVGHLCREEIETHRARGMVSTGGSERFNLRGRMGSRDVSVQYLISLPPAMAAAFPRLEGRGLPAWVVAADPPGPGMGSGAATAHLLATAWRLTGADRGFEAWLREGRKLVLHAGGQSRRLPAYAPVGKLLLPLPVLRWSRGQRLDQTLLDVQLPEYERLLRHAPEPACVLLTSGDVLVRLGRQLPEFPAVDVVAVGVRVPPEVAQNFGVLFCPRRQPGRLAFARQKPSAAEIRRMSLEYRWSVDTGIWLLSARAARVLMRRCGWEEESGGFSEGRPVSYEFYGGFALALGTDPVRDDAEIRALSCAVVELPEGEFYHFGATAQMIESVVSLQNRVSGEWTDQRHPDQVLQNCRVAPVLDRERHHTLWIENSVVSGAWHLGHEQVITGVPENDWPLRLPSGVCLDLVPVDEEAWCVRVYGFRDGFRGAWNEATTRWLGRPAFEWFVRRGLDGSTAGLAPGLDLQFCPLFPVVTERELDPEFVQWLVSGEGTQGDRWARFWQQVERLSAAQLALRVNPDRLYAQRERLRREAARALRRHCRWSVFSRLDLEATARLVAAEADGWEALAFGDDDPPMLAVREAMFQAAVRRVRGEADWEGLERQAFERLQEMLVREAQVTPANPRRVVLEDQIVWARSPVRLDLAGGWTDTPPYCLEHGGRVVNVAVDLNGQPPIQVFAKCIPEPVLVIRSIDLSAETRLRTFADLEAYGEPGNPFGLARAALALAGFLPRFHVHGGFASLEEQLREFGGGIELSLVAAVPKGSGLGTSSILGMTLLAALSDLCGLDWDRETLCQKTLVLEQLLGTGGGWQDQVGAMERGVKLIETRPGLRQTPQLHWLPQHLLEQPPVAQCFLLYYTGLTRLARNILGEVVRSMFLNDAPSLAVLEEIGRNAERAALAIQRCDAAGLAECIRESWRLNQQLDPGTNPPGVQAILDAVASDLAAAKLAGAGGGGYLLMLARDPFAAQRIRERLTRNPPNPRARFVDFTISATGLQVTRS
ncbi:bifunctional fucokinase/fucose-1-phosphate guanylyltransferase [Limisphaera sp. VF-2]|jgi:galactokinase/mevalonate kinase-like predicted kinase|uniref:bifunctional fucokinase/fucose-1-phosphate guanylyltransferase n=1 Tax=Limisphaera sp. VF-2 TaxID=3400418 RepID=UPI0017687E57